MPCREQMSSPWDLNWESYSASVDVLQRENINAAPLENAPNSKDLQLPSIRVASGTINPVSPDFKIRTPDRFVVDLAEHRRGYSYCVQMETPDHSKAAAMEQDCVTPRHMLDKENSDDFSSFAGLQEGPSTAALFSGYAGPASSPFAAHTRQPFGDSGSCRSRLSDYGYDTASDEEEEAEEQQLRSMAFRQGPAQEQEQQVLISPPADERTGFWADVGAPLSQLTDGTPGDSVPKQMDGVQWEANDWCHNINKDNDREPDEDMECVNATHPHKAGVLLPWDMD